MIDKQVRKRMNSCDKKIRYSNFESANRNLKRIIKENGLRKGEILEWYACIYCDGYHIGHSEESK